MRTLFLTAGLILSAGFFGQTKPVVKTKATIDNKKEEDRASIKSMAGVYKVSFDFAETFSTDTGYKYHPRYREWGIEYVLLVEDSPYKIALQHLLIINDSIIIKHWRQDWMFENKEIYNYFKDNEWVKTTLTDAQAKGTWTQKVYQVDDSPRYQSFGTWVHIDGKHFWEGVNDSPLPRREFTKRNDYNVMKRHSRMEIFNDGWVLNQDNEKIVRNNGIDKVLCWEKGIERFTKGYYNAGPAIKWWEKQKQYWADVRIAWEEVYVKTRDLKLADKIDKKKLYESLFSLGDKVCKDTAYAQGSAKADIKKVIDAYLKVS
ncbi:MAG: hypothetical protein H0W73_12955 [Bacteroidetes bacterium]|nr:hypothetical protein [Bacteroidota bacterium]